ncbi:hypothetical protein AXF42_Ash007677 [Apostasia shenzhenica]|uniref:DUF1771 domain-containing protein n=1 Tax=Apostasia shenzhenica TaxID=1088818 RepID=A0A2I0A648_9ASPA|nr:hypothetical protein AXF42_Ash007677 [Apostasia shenzhenica]
MASSSSCAVENDDLHLKALHDAFVSFFSLEDIALAYIKAGHDVVKAGEILSNIHESRIFDPSIACNSDFRQLDSSTKRHTENSSLVDRTCSERKPQRVSASVGTVSSFIGKTYLRPASSMNESHKTTKPPKLSVDEPSATESGNEVLCSESVFEPDAFGKVSEPRSLTSKDMEEFLFSMLGDGFKLSMGSIREVLGKCGYNVKQSMDELLSLSAEAVNNNKEHIHNLANWANADSSSHEEECKMLLPGRFATKTCCVDKEKTNLSKEILESLFSVPDRFEEEPKVKRLEWGLNRTRVIGQRPVTKPLEEFDLSSTRKIESMQPDNEKDDDEKYQGLRRAAKQHWAAMKLYYESAVDAFTMGNHTQANYCLEQGKECYQLAREVDEKLAGMILKEREPNEQDKELHLNLHGQSVSESIRLLKLHLLSLASIPSFRYLKVTVTTDDGSTSRGKRRWKMVLKLLEDESIRWSEVEGSPGEILIPLEEIDRNKLSF